MTKSAIDDALGALQGAQRFKLARGVVGSTGQLALGLLVIWGIVAWKLTDSIVFDAFLMIAGLAASIFAVWFVRSTRTYAKEIPALALLEGAEYVAYRQMEMEAASREVGTPLKVVGNSPQGRISPTGASSDE